MQTVLVIGASRGIGLEFVRQYLAMGWQVHATTRTPDTPGELGDLLGDLHLRGLDVRDDAQLADLVEDVRSIGCDVVVHNAGVGRGTPREEMMAVNARAPIQTIEALLAAGGVRRGGKVAIMTSQLGARRGRTASLGDYGDSKAALNDEFRLRAPHWSSAYGVVAIVVHPGWVRTDMGGSAAPLSVEDSVAGMVELIDGLTDDRHGQFLTWDGRQHAW
jgi:NAD(P)-dependent dehydrogenase (short-subunit alcohol dehydrogenase family)